MMAYIVATVIVQTYCLYRSYRSRINFTTIHYKHVWLTTWTVYKKRWRKEYTHVYILPTLGWSGGQCKRRCWVWCVEQGSSAWLYREICREEEREWLGWGWHTPLQHLSAQYNKLILRKCQGCNAQQYVVYIGRSI